MDSSCKDNSSEKYWDNGTEHMPFSPPAGEAAMPNAHSYYDVSLQGCKAGTTAHKDVKECQVSPDTPAKQSRSRNELVDGQVPRLPFEVWARVIEDRREDEGDSDYNKRLAAVRQVCRFFADSVGATVRSLRPRQLPGPPGWETRFSKLTTLSLWGRRDARFTTGCGMLKIRAMPEDFAAIRSLKSLATLDLSGGGHNVTDEALAHIQELPSLRTLSLRRCWFVSDVGLATVASSNHSLTSLDLCECWFITDQGVSSLRCLTGLTSLDLQQCELVTRAGLDCLQPLASLSKICLAWCKGIRDNALEVLRSFSQLTHLDASRCPAITSTGVTALASLTRLTHLDLSMCPEISDVALASVGLLHNLRDLQLAGCHQVSNVGVRHLAALSELRRLDLSNLPNLTESGAHTLGSLTNLERLSLRGCCLLPDAAVAQFGKLVKLEFLNLARCDALTNTALTQLASLNSVKELNLSGCQELTHDGIEWLLPRLTSLTTLDVSRCRHCMKTATLMEILNQRADLEVDL